MKLALCWILFPLMAAPNGAILEGTTVNRVTGEGVPGVTVKLAPASAPYEPSHVIKSVAAGAFRIEGVPAGDYVLSFGDPPGFISPSPVDPICKPFHVYEGPAPARLRVPMRPLGKMRVHVVDPEGRPVPHVRVEILVATGGGGSLGLTNSEGRYTADRLLPGAYKLRARPVLAGTPLGQRSERLSPLPGTPPEGERWIWAPTWFPGTTEMAAAETVVLREGADLAQYEIRLRSAPVYRLRGVVSDEEGRPAPGVRVWLLSEAGWGTAEAQVLSGPDGIFEFPAVRFGEWEISADTKAGETKLQGFARLAMPQRDRDDVKLQVSPPFPLSAEVEGISPDEAGKYGWPVLLLPAEGRQEISHAQTQPDGRLHFEDVYSGRYLIAEFMGAPGHYLKSVLLGTQDVTGRELDLTPQSRLKLVYGANPARARGMVEGGAGVKVVFVQTAQDNYIHGQDVRVAICDPDGRFALEGLRPATYYAFAFAIDGVNHGAVREAVFSLGLSRQGQVVHLYEGQTATLDLKITPFPETLQRP